MTFQELLKTVEGAVVIGGCIAIIVFGKLSFYLAIALGVAYTAVNVPTFLAWIQKKYKQLDEWL
jgi:phosphotransferase system  glucose/maltose/N-acetylglucosamine-specific IIC component